MPRNSRSQKETETHRGAASVSKSHSARKIMRAHSGKRHFTGNQDALAALRKLKKLTLSARGTSPPSGRCFPYG